MNFSDTNWNFLKDRLTDWWDSETELDIEREKERERERETERRTERERESGDNIGIS